MVLAPRKGTALQLEIGEASPTALETDRSLAGGPAARSSSAVPNRRPGGGFRPGQNPGDRDWNRVGSRLARRNDRHDGLPLAIFFPPAQRLRWRASPCAGRGFQTGAVPPVPGHDVRLGLQAVKLLGTLDEGKDSAGNQIGRGL